MNEAVLIRPLREEETDLRLFAAFRRRQVVEDCYRRGPDGGWEIRPDPFIDDWSREDYDVLVQCLKTTLRTGGVVYGAFFQRKLKGFASVEAVPMGSRGQYRDLTCLHVSEELRGRGIGRRLFQRAADWAKARGGEKLYISSHSAVESQRFYAAMGCVDAREPQPEHVEREPFDRQLEYNPPAAAFLSAKEGGR